MSTPRSLRLYPDYGSDSPVWSSDGRVALPQLHISAALADALRAWQVEGLEGQGDPGQDEEKSEEEYAREGQRLADWLSRETGFDVTLDI